MVADLDNTFEIVIFLVQEYIKLSQHSSSALESIISFLLSLTGSPQKTWQVNKLLWEPRKIFIAS